MEHCEVSEVGGRDDLMSATNHSYMLNGLPSLVVLLPSSLREDSRVVLQ